MRETRLVRGLALTTILLGLGNVLFVGYRIATYQPPPDDGGTNIAGLIWVIFVVLGGVVMAGGGAGALYLRFLTPTRWPRRLVAAGLLVSALAGLAVSVGQVGPALGYDVSTPLGISRTFLLGLGGGALVGVGAITELVAGNRP